MNKSPITWYRGTWDYGKKANIGFDAIPTIMDADSDGYMDGWKSGIGWGTDLYLSELVPYNGDVWVPRVDSGYFYMGQDEYYLYASKGTVKDIPTDGVLSIGEAYSPAPIVVTLGDSEFDSGEPFAKTYEPGRTTNKYRRRYDLSDRRLYMANGNVADGIYPIDYTFILDEMQFIYNNSIECYPSGAPITVEYETTNSITYDAIDVDMNPLNSYEVANSFCVIVDTDTLVADSIELTNANRYVSAVSKPILIIAAVKDKNGCPIKDIEVTFDADWGTFTDDSVNTAWDGTASTWFIPSYVNVTGVISATCDGANGILWVPGGKI